MPHLKVETTYVCDRRCPNCNRFTSLAPAGHNEDVDPDVLAAMLEKCGKTGRIWTRITLTGGEPTMHPRFEDLIHAIMRYKRLYNPKCYSGTYTYHHPVHFEKVERMLKQYPDLVVLDTMKEKPREHRYAVCLAPVDDPKMSRKHDYKGCHLGGRLCGLGYDYRGFYCCSIAAGIARVFGLDIAVKDIGDVTVESMIAQFKDVCPKCGFYQLYVAKCDKDLLSRTWRRQFRSFNRRQRRGRKS